MEKHFSFELLVLSSQLFFHFHLLPQSSYPTGSLDQAMSIDRLQLRWKAPDWSLGLSCLVWFVPSASPHLDPFTRGKIGWIKPIVLLAFLDLPPLKSISSSRTLFLNRKNYSSASAFGAFAGKRASEWFGSLTVKVQLTMFICQCAYYNLLLQVCQYLVTFN